MPRLPLLLGYGIEFSERLLYGRFRPHVAHDSLVGWAYSTFRELIPNWSDFQSRCNVSNWPCPPDML
jgi:hypothetical protein